MHCSDDAQGVTDANDNNGSMSGSQDDEEDDGSSSNSGDSGSSSSSLGHTAQPTAAADATDPEQSPEAAEPSVPSATLYNPTAAATAAQLLQLLMSHSQFMTALLLPGQHQLPVLPAAVAAVATPLESYMPVVDALWVSSSEASSSINGSSSSSTGPGAFKHQLILLIEVLLDFTRFFSANQNPDLAKPDNDDDRLLKGAAAASGAVDPALLQSLLQLLQVAYGGSLSDSDRATLRVLLLLDQLLPQPTAQRAGSSIRSAALAAADGDKAAAEMSTWQQLQWPRCLFGSAAKLYYEQQQRLQGSAASTAAVGLLQQQLLRDLSPLEPLRCAITVIMFPDRRRLNPDHEPGSGDSLEQLYYSGSRQSTSSSSSSSSS
jgi:hypothetical protein